MQSDFRAHHSTETALLSLLSDVYTAVDKSQVTLLALFDASSAFDMVDHEILLQRLETSVGLSGSPLQHALFLGSCQFGVPQGSVLGPLLYILFTALGLISPVGSPLCFIFFSQQLFQSRSLSS